MPSGTRHLGDLQLECARVLHKTLLAPASMYACETMLWREKERPRIRAVQMNNLREMLGIRMINKSPKGTDKGAV